MGNTVGNRRQGLPQSRAHSATPLGWTLRLAKFFLGLGLSSTGVWLSLQADLGVSPWDVLHSGISEHTVLSFGMTVIAVGTLVAAVSALLGVYPGVGTVLNVIFIGLGIDALLATPWLTDLPDAPLVWRYGALIGATVVLSAGVALYIGAGLGAGPRDSLMVAIHRRGMSLGWARLIIEILVLALGWLLGGAVGVGTVLLALGTGFMVQLANRIFRQGIG